MSFGLSWAKLPPGAPEIWSGGGLREQYLQPAEPDGTLDPTLLAEVGGPVLKYLEDPGSPSAFVDQLLAHEEGAPRSRGPLQFVYGAAKHYSMAAWGALTLNDAERCRIAIERTLEVFREDPDFHVAVALREQMHNLEVLWHDLHGSPLRR